MSTPDELRAVEVRVAEIMIAELKLEDVTAEMFDPHLDLVDELGIDSMDLTTVALLIQDEYGVVIDDEDYPQLTTLRKMARHVLALKAA
jgi:acyl carrier protein